MKSMGTQAIRDYLTCRAVRTILFYFNEFHDGPSSHWLSNFKDFAARERSTFRDGDAFLVDMLYAPKETGSYTVAHPRGYFSRRFSFTIDPHNIAQRVLRVREQLAAEWVEDLALIGAENLELSRLALERALGPARETAERRRRRMFDEGTQSGQTPLRYKNYNSLKVLTTQHATARLTSHLRDSSNHEYMWLIQFIRCYGPIIDGNAFVEAIMAAGPQPRNNPAFTVVPQHLASRIMSLRAAIADEWIQILGRVPKEHLALHRNMLELSMMSSSKKIAVEALSKNFGISKKRSLFEDPEDFST